MVLNFNGVNASGDLAFNAGTALRSSTDGAVPITMELFRQRWPH